MVEKKKGLDLRQFEVEPDSELKDRDGIKYALTSHIPMETTDKFLDIKATKDMSAEEIAKFAKEDRVLTRQIVREILLVKNDEKKVDALMKKISLQEFVYILEFITEWIKDVKASKEKKN